MMLLIKFVTTYLFWLNRGIEMANVNLYVNSSDNRVVNKNLSAKLTYICDLTEVASIENPIIRIDNANVSVLNYNYCYIDIFDRYYYCKVSIEGTVAILECSVDVLMSYKKSILNTTCLVKRNEFLKDDRLVDNEIPIRCKKRIVTYELSDDIILRGFGCYIIGVI